MSLHNTINDLQNRLNTAQLERTRAEGAQEHAEQVARTAREELKREFDVDTVEQGEQLLAQLCEQLEHQIARINAQLDEIGVA